MNWKNSFEQPWSPMTPIPLLVSTRPFVRDVCSNARLLQKIKTATAHKKRTCQEAEQMVCDVQARNLADEALRMEIQKYRDARLARKKAYYSTYENLTAISEIARSLSASRPCTSVFRLSKPTSESPDRKERWMSKISPESGRSSPKKQRFYAEEEDDDTASSLFVYDFEEEDCDWSRTSTLCEKAGRRPSILTPPQLYRDFNFLNGLPFEGSRNLTVNEDPTACISQKKERGFQQTSCAQTFQYEGIPFEHYEAVKTLTAQLARTHASLEAPFAPQASKRLWTVASITARIIELWPELRWHLCTFCESLNHLRTAISRDPSEECIFCEAIVPDRLDRLDQLDRLHALDQGSAGTAKIRPLCGSCQCLLKKVGSCPGLLTRLLCGGCKCDQEHPTEVEEDDDTVTSVNLDVPCSFCRLMKMLTRSWMKHVTVSSSMDNITSRQTEKRQKPHSMKKNRELEAYIDKLRSLHNLRSASSRSAQKDAWPTRLRKHKPRSTNTILSVNT